MPFFAFLAEHWFAAATITSLGASLYQGNEARKETKKASSEDTKARILQARQQRVQVLKERMVAQANLNVQTAATGTAGSSGATGAASSVQSQFGNSMAFSEATDLFGRNSMVHKGKAAKAEYRSGIASTLFNIGLVGVQNNWQTGIKNAFTPKPVIEAPMTPPTVTYTRG